MSLAHDTNTRLRFSGRTFMAYVLQPLPPIATWLDDIDRIAEQPENILAQRPVILDLSILEPDRPQVEAIFAALRARRVRVIAVEGIDADLVDPMLAPLEPAARSGKVIEFPGPGRNPQPVEARRRSAETDGSLLIEHPVRSGQTVVFPHGDVTVLGAVSSGAEVVAGGSIHVYGALRGRAIAGSSGERRARIFCRRFEAELVAIDGCYMTAEMADRTMLGRPVEIRLDGDSIVLEPNG